jgi:hypothetical protein
VVIVVVALCLGVAAQAVAAPSSDTSIMPTLVKPAYTHENAKIRSHEWAQYDNREHWHLTQASPDYPYECRGPYENVVGKTQWACFGYFENAGSDEWQVNIEPYGEQVYYALHTI